VLRPDLNQGVTNGAPIKILSDRRIWWLAFFSVVGALIFFFKNSEAFPSAALDLNIPRQDITVKARDWAHRLGYNKTGTIDSTTFFEDEGVKTFLEFELGTERGAKLMGGEIPVWMWVSRFCKEHDPEECSVILAPDGSFLKFRHTIPNDLALPVVSHDEAEKMAREFTEMVAGKSLEGYSLVGDETSTQLKRKDYRFIWENRKTEYKGARQRIRVEVNGNRVGAFTQMLKLPEEWDRRYERMRSYNLQLYSIAAVFWNILCAVAGVAFLWGVTTHKIRWRAVMFYAAIFAVVQMLESLNGFPTIISNYEPLKTTYQAYISEQLFSRVVGFLGFFVIGVVFTGAAELIYRVSSPARVAAENWFKPKALSGVEVSKGLLVGNISPMLYLGWIITYYILGKHVGFYTPLSLENYRAVASSFVPAFSAVSLGLFASAHEEILYRVIALSLSQKLLFLIPKVPKNKVVIFWICNLFQAAAWGFMHSTYPQQPSYARGVELTFSGLIFGYIFQTFGLIPCIVSHYLIDCFLGAKIFIESAQPELSVPALLAVSPFAAVLIYSLLKRRQAVETGSEPDVSLLSNEAVSESIARKTEPEVEQNKHVKYDPVSRKTLICIALGALGILLVSAPTWRTLSAGSNVRLTLNRAQAEKIAEKALKDRGVDARQYRCVSWLSADSTGEELQYLREQVNRVQLNNLANLEDFGFTWAVRYFRPFEIREYQELLDGRGKEYSPMITEPEDAPGASLNEKDAIKIASDYVHKMHTEFLPIVFDSIEETRREHRIDFRIFFESPLQKIADAPNKLQVKLVGDKIALYKQGWNIPDTWKNEFERKTLKDNIMSIVTRVYQTVIVIALVWWMIGLLRSGAVRWRLPLIVSGALLILALLNEANSYQTIFSNYSTSTSIDMFTQKTVLESLQRLMWSTLMSLFPAALALAVFRLIAPDVSIYSLLRVGFRPVDKFEKVQQRLLWRDAVVCGFSIALVRGALGSLSHGVECLVSPQVQSTSLWAVTHLANLWSPQLDVVTECLSRSVKETFNIGVLVGLYQKYAGSFKKALILVVVMMLIQNNQHFWQDYLVDVAHTVIDWVCVYIFVAKFAKRNIFAYMMYGLASEILSRLPTLAFHAPKVMLNDIISCIVIFLLPIAWVLWLYRNKITPDPVAESQAQPPSVLT
jgi:Type II CAAX prenyl endopeptidase Rce1-like